MSDSSDTVFNDCFSADSFATRRHVQARCRSGSKNSGVAGVGYGRDGNGAVIGDGGGVAVGEAIQMRSGGGIPGIGLVGLVADMEDIGGVEVRGKARLAGV